MATLKLEQLVNSWFETKWDESNESYKTKRLFFDENKRRKFLFEGQQLSGIPQPRNSTAETSKMGDCWASELRAEM
jgi:hypothetical protein